MNAQGIEIPGIAYPVWIGDDAGVREEYAALLVGRDVLIVSDGNVAGHHLAPLREASGGAARVETLVLPAGEGEKTLGGLERILDALVVGGFHRDALVVALGGGVVSDLAGFAAACYQRGVDWIAVATTLLAQVDAAIGGKTAVNHRAGKNLVGAFHDPVAVWADPARLATLPEREYLAGFGEVVKYGLGFDAEFFAWLETNRSALLHRDTTALAHAIRRCARCKLELVAADPRERGRRILLNLGHSFGHALEAVLGYGTWLHGEAVAAGLVAAAELSCARGRLPAEVPPRLRRLLQTFRLPTEIPGEADEASLLAALALDKKIAAGRLRFVGLEALGRAAVWEDVGAGEITRVLRRLRSG
ncbi:MAG TPA: 3-dehydroquinate synthase [Gammaproteobacteria bacterium]|nr:3-dehydroquinate synthase [Gammaproteobacteria bacterium]